MLKPETLQAHWFAYLYEQTEDETELIACMLRLLGPPALAHSGNRLRRRQALRTAGKRRSFRYRHGYR